MTDLLNIVQGIDKEELTDMTEVKVGGGSGRSLLPSGTAFVRLSGYIEFGTHPQEYLGKKKDPALEFRLQFRVVGGVGVNLDGEEENFVLDEDYLPPISTYDIAQSQYAKSGAVALFNAVNIEPATATHFMHKLGQLYTLQIGVKKNPKTGKMVQDIDFKKLQKATDAATRKPYTSYADKDGDIVAIPQLKSEDIRVFLWDRPQSVTKEQYKAMWDSIHIDGEYEKKDGDNVIKVSKNFLQEKCLSALNFENSSLQQLLDGVEFPNITAKADDKPDPEKVQDVPSVPDDEDAGTIAVPDAE